MTANTKATRPRVLIDATNLPSDLRGVGRYIEGLCQALHELRAPIAVVVRPEHREHFESIAPSLRVVTAPSALGARGARFLWEQVGLPALASKLGVETVHSTHYTFPLKLKQKRVVTMHDATYFTDPDAHSNVKRRFFRWWIRKGLAQKHTVIVPSASAEFELEASVNKIQAEVLVIHHGVDLKLFTPPSQVALTSLYERLGIPKQGYFLFLGTIEPRKQVPALISAYRAFRGEFGDDAPWLLISGARGWDSTASRMLDELSPDEGIRELGYVPVHDIPTLLGGSVAVVYPSLAEGFGLPVLEAMASGGAVITTPYTALPEVGGEAAFYVEATPAGIREGLEAMYREPDRAARLRALGLSRAQTFTWDSAARKHLAAYGLAEFSNEVQGER